jgi:hypothetical protein
MSGPRWVWMTLSIPTMLKVIHVPGGPAVHVPRGPAVHVPGGPAVQLPGGPAAAGR